METPNVKPAEIITKPPKVSFSTQGIPAPSPLYVTEIDSLTLNANSLPFAGATTFTVRARLLRADGTITPFEKILATTTGSGALNIPLAEGFLLSLSVLVSSVGGASPVGQVYIQVHLTRGFPNPTLITMLISDYANANYLATWPGGRFAQAQQGRGNIRAIVGTDPAAGAEISESVPAQTRWRLIAIFAQLTTSITVATRTVSWVLDDGVNTYWRAISFGTQGASLTQSYEAGTFGSSGIQGNTLSMEGLPYPCWMTSTFRIRTLTTNLQAGDNWGPPTYLVEEWVNA